MVVTRNSEISKSFRKKRHIIKECIPDLRPRLSAPNYREESPDDIRYRRELLKVKVNTPKPISQLRIRSNSSRKKAIKAIHRYQLRKKSNQVKSSLSQKELSHKPANNTDKKSESRIEDVTIEKPIKYNSNVNTQSSKTAFKHRVNGSFIGYDKIENNQKCYENGRRYPIRLRRQPPDVYMVDRKTKRKAKWNNSIISPMESMLGGNHVRKIGIFSKQSDTDDTEEELLKDELKFERRRQRSVFRARSELKPVNALDKDFFVELQNKEQINAIKSSLADIEPMNIDRSITFDSVGGNRHCIQALKESVILPLVYPEVFEKLSITPPRGLLFYGPPGSGKTLVARALVNECFVSSTKKISFFMRKGADCLSKWVGESERQLRLLFDHAYRMRPSIIFFDEIDGLAPVRSSRQDQIHSSIVSTLLSLIDGLDDRGDIIVIGATNRLDAIDPALRRPGRFDREFLFTLPDNKVRQEIIKIHTKNWKQPLSEEAVFRLADSTNGFSGADLKGVIVEAGLCSLRRRYPQIYRNPKKLKLDLQEVKVLEEDIEAALQLVKPSAQRSLLPIFNRLPKRIMKLLEPDIINLWRAVIECFSDTIAETENLKTASSDDCTLLSMDAALSGLAPPLGTNKIFSIPFYKPRILLTGYETEHLLSAIFFDVSEIKVHQFDWLSCHHQLSCQSNTGAVLSGTSGGVSSCLEERLYQTFLLAAGSTRSIVLLPQIDLLFQSLDFSGQTLLVKLITRPAAATKTVVLATLSSLWQRCSMNNDSNNKQGLLQVWSLDKTMLDNHPQSAVLWQELGEFINATSRTLIVPPPSIQCRIDYFSSLIEEALFPPEMLPETTRSLNYFLPLEISESCTEELPEEEESVSKSLTKDEAEKLEIEEESILRKSRMVMRTIISILAKERKFHIFLNPVDEEEAPDYYSIITNPMDLSTIRQKIDLYCYRRFDQFKSDLNLISVNALLYNPPRTNYLRDIRRHAYDFLDFVATVLEEQWSSELERAMINIDTARTLRAYYTTLAEKSTTRSEELVDYLEDLNTAGGVCEVNPSAAAAASISIPMDGPLLRSQIDVYNKFYRPGGGGDSRKFELQSETRTHACTELKVTIDQQNKAQEQPQTKQKCKKKVTKQSQSDSELINMKKLDKGLRERPFLSMTDVASPNSPIEQRRARSVIGGSSSPLKIETSDTIRMFKIKYSNQNNLSGNQDIEENKRSSLNSETFIQKQSNMQFDKNQNESKSPKHKQQQQQQQQQHQQKSEDKQQEQTNQISISSSPVQIDKTELENIIRLAAEKTTGCSLVQMEKLYFIMHQEIRQFSHLSNRRKLTKILAKVVEKYV